MSGQKKAGGLWEADRELGEKNRAGPSGPSGPSGAEASRRAQGSGLQTAGEPSLTEAQGQVGRKEKKKCGKRKDGAGFEPAQEAQTAGHAADAAKRRKVDNGQAAILPCASVRLHYSPRLPVMPSVMSVMSVSVTSSAGQPAVFTFA